MEKQSELYFTTGEFAKILGVSKHTLFHYDDIKLFCPAHTEDNGYRYYFLWQMDTFEVIRALQKLSMPLSEIRNYMASRSPDKFLALTRDKEGEIDREIERLKSLKKFIQMEQKNIEEAMNATLDSPFIVRIPDEYLMISNVRDTAEKTIAEEIAAHVKLMERHHVTLNTVGACCHLSDLEEGRYDHYFQIYSRMDRKVSALKPSKKAGGSYVQVYYQGYDGSLKRPYEMISRFARENSLVLDDIWYEDLLQDELTAKCYDDYIVKASVRIK
ncbi:MerR family transcriptional regulator [Clostridium sp. AM58-1XD]|uniref:MerR family transcriptional regulator n=1 Tax=Clostridium sp. AM58-1XD TaxID=2292307 RepID=UPI000E4A3DE7|nr:MerR family transcriptional regulator [Clostridium sp. AM58-1XD]RGY96845.1 MerR family transcriptional regulator [Clostridium sp. AM58-1XD]